MKNRPWVLVLLAGIQFLTPLFNVFLNAWAHGVNPTVILTWWQQRPALEIFESFALMPLAGWAIFQMKRWSYFVFFTALLWNLAGNLRYWDYALSAIPVQALILCAIGNAILVGYILLPTVRRTFFDPTLRWWESSPRFEVDMPFELRTDSVVKSGRILNFSQGGVMIQSEEVLPISTPFTLSFSLLSLKVEIPARVVYSRPSSDDGYYYGVQFIHTPASLKRFDKIATGLRLMGFVEKNPQKGNTDLVMEGVVRFFKSGRGLVPTISPGKHST